MKLIWNRKDKEMYDLKHELISAQIKLENADRAMDKLKEENQELQMKIVQLETEMKITEELGTVEGQPFLRSKAGNRKR